MKKKYIYFTSYMAGLVNGMIGSGGGIIALPMLYKILDNEKNAHNTVCFFVFPLSVISASICKKNIEFHVIFPICVGAFFGGVVGKILSNKIKLKYLKIFFSLIIIYIGIRGLI